MKIPSVCDRYRTKLNRRIWEMTGLFEKWGLEIRPVSRVFRKLMDKELAIKDSDRCCLNLHRKWTFAALISAQILHHGLCLSSSPEPNSLTGLSWLNPITYFVVNGFLLIADFWECFPVALFPSYTAIEILYLWFLSHPGPLSPLDLTMTLSVIIPAPH